MANKKSTSSKKKKKKNSSDDTMKFLLVLVIAGIAIAMLVFMQKNGENGETPDGTPTMAESMTPSLTKGAETPVPTKVQEPTGTPKPTEAATTNTPKPTQTKAPTAAPTEEPEPTPDVDVLSAEDAQKLVKASVKSSYTVQLINDHLWVGDSEYYQFCVLDENNQMLYPFLVVEQLEGGLYCYDAMEGTVSVFTTFPLEGSGGTQVTPTPEEQETISADEAYRILCTYSKESLKLAKEAAQYDAEYGSELTLINRNNCYRINLFEVADNGRVRNCGEFYISVDGTKCYYIDSETDEFVLIQK